MSQTVSIQAADRRDLMALIAVRKWLEAGATQVVVHFVDGRDVTFTRDDLPAIYRKITYSM